MPITKYKAECDKALERVKAESEIPKGKELPPLIDDESSEEPKAINVHDYHTAFREICQGANLINLLEDWIDSFIVDIYDNQSSDWQHGFDTGEKLTELRQLIGKAKEGMA